jgi:hypothetical protein
MKLKQFLALAVLPAWLFAKPGAVAYTSAGEEDSPTTPICAGVAAYREYANENGAKGCTERPAGVKVVIDAIVPATASFAAIAKVHARSGAFSGYTAVGELLPAIPPGIAVTLAPAANETLTISTSQRAELDAGLNLGARVPAVTVRFDPANDDKRDLLVRVTGGKYAGRTGWLFARQAFVRDSPINVLKL